MTDHPKLLAGKRVLIIGGLKRLAWCYKESAEALGCDKPKWKHHDLNTLGKSQPHLIILICSNCNHQSNERANKLANKLNIPIVKVYKHQKSSFLYELIERLQQNQM